MGTLKNVNRDDLLNRYSGWTFVETVIGDMTKVEFKDGSLVVQAEAKTLVVDDAYQNIHAQMVGGAGIALGDYTFQGSTKFGGSLTIAPNGAVDIVGTDAATARIRTVRFQASANGAGAVQVGHSRGSEGSASALLSGDRIGQFIFVGDDGSSTNSAGPVIRAVTSENWGGSAKGSYIKFEIIIDGDTAETEGARVEGSATAADTFLMLYDVDNATLERVTVGAADSGGTGFKVLRIPN